MFHPHNSSDKSCAILNQILLFQHDRSMSCPYVFRYISLEARPLKDNCIVLYLTLAVCMIVLFTRDIHILYTCMINNSSSNNRKLCIFGISAKQLFNWAYLVTYQTEHVKYEKGKSIIISCKLLSVGERHFHYKKWYIWHGCHGNLTSWGKNVYKKNIIWHQFFTQSV